MTNDDLTTALRDRVRDEHPDVDHLIRVSTLAGTRLLKAQNLVTLYQSLGGDQLLDTAVPGAAGNRAKPADAM